MNDNDKLEQQSRQALNASVEEIDAATLSRIRQVRARALEKAGAKSFNWFGIATGAMATASVMVFAVMILLNNEPAVQPLPAEDIELITSLDELELYEDLEFYQWLAEYES